ncbi:MAG: Unknown protein [uncultured Sulfurovum sp.]|uniref:DUF4166 domain-containing protein n=1 Tax=uncultured Sulfurovum sp. TaxID=269237 RepID=A0A6S6SD16_9BACT|nr:MAG: Unknown protein [uncultured Sulfurovum sp.]
MTLYERILGDEFSKLPPLIQKMHIYEGSNLLKGVVEIERGKALIAKVLNFLMKLPKEQSNALLSLELKAKKEKELWRRTFGKDTFLSTQYQSGKQMVEQMGLLKMYFDVYVENERLYTVLDRTTFLGLSVSKAFQVHISSIVKEKNEKVEFAVKVRTFSSKVVINYNGVIEL